MSNWKDLDRFSSRVYLHPEWEEVSIEFTRKREEIFQAFNREQGFLPNLDEWSIHDRLRWYSITKTADSEEFGPESRPLFDELQEIYQRFVSTATAGSAEEKPERKD